MPATSTPPHASTPRNAGFARRNWGKLAVLGLLVIPAAVLALWATIALAYSYSEGDRVGYNQKLSRKGWVCKTWEGELALSNVPGQAPELFRYSVRDDAVARQIETLGGRRVQLTYEQHVGVPTSCFGETEYFAVGVKAVTDQYAPNGAPAAPQAPAATPAAAPAAVPGTAPAVPAP